MKTETFSEAARKNIKDILNWSFSVLVSFLRTGDTLVNLKDVDNFDEFIASLYSRRYTERKNLHFLQEFLLICLYFV